MPFTEILAIQPSFLKAYFIWLLGNYRKT